MWNQSRIYELEPKYLPAHHAGLLVKLSASGQRRFIRSHVLGSSWPPRQSWGLRVFLACTLWVLHSTVAEQPVQGAVDDTASIVPVSESRNFFFPGYVKSRNIWRLNQVVSKFASRLLLPRGITESPPDRQQIWELKPNGRERKCEMLQADRHFIWTAYPSTYDIKNNTG